MVYSETLRWSAGLVLTRLNRPSILTHPLRANVPCVSVIVDQLPAPAALAPSTDGETFAGSVNVRKVASTGEAGDFNHPESANWRRSDVSEKASGKLARDSRFSTELRRPPRLSALDRVAKRAFDIVVATAAFAALAPAMLLVGLAIRASSPGPAIFKQTRRGFDGREFKILKFRTMIVAEDGRDIKQAMRGDARVTNVGRWLRRCSLDELPQLVNVLKGDMSLVGPRPHAVAHDDAYDAAIREYSLRRAVKPGLTGAAQVVGLRGETRTLAQMQARVAKDIWYIENWSMWLDIRIAFQTLFTLFRHEAY